MANFIVTYDLRQVGQNYTCIIARLEALRAHRGQQSVWFVKYAGTPTQLRDHLAPCCDANDKLFVARIDNNWASQNMQDTAAWLNA